jgi:hypothetical protein
MMLPSALLRLWSAALTPLEATSTLAITALSTLVKSAIAFPVDAALGALGRMAAAGLPPMLLIDIMMFRNLESKVIGRGAMNLRGIVATRWGSWSADDPSVRIRTSESARDPAIAAVALTSTPMCSLLIVNEIPDRRFGHRRTGH